MMRTFAGSILVAMALLTCSVAPAACAEYAANAWLPREYPIGFWCGPPDNFTTVDRYKEIREAGFTFITPPCTWGGPHGPAATVERNRRILEVCRQTGFRFFLADNRMPPRITGVPDAKARLDAIVRDYSRHPALAGYSVGDEPNANAFDGLAEVVAYLREKDPHHPAYINLFPYTPGRAWEAESYRDYLDTFIQKIQPFALSYDHYHFRSSGDGPFFIRNLVEAREASLKASIPFWNIVLLTQHGDYRNLTLGEIRYEAMQSLAYGAKGLKWFTYWEPQDSGFQWSHAAINLDGSRDNHYDMVKTVNRELQTLGKPLLRANSYDVYHSGTVPDGGRAQTPSDPVRVTDSTPVTVGLFRDSDHWHYAVLATANYRTAGSVEVSVRTHAESLRRMDLETRKWTRISDIRSVDGVAHFSCSLPAGGAVLMRWK